MHMFLTYHQTDFRRLPDEDKILSALRPFRIPPGGFLFFLVACICLAVSALYEMIEWWAAVALGQGAEHFLGTQGDEWDTQWDMFLALVGAIAAQLLFSRPHDREIRRFGG